MSECPEYQDEEVKQYFEEVYSDKGKTLAQKFFTLLNNRALYDTDQISGYALPFHCYSEPNGDVVFTKKRRSRDDYDAEGNPISHESKNGGCLGIILLVLFFLSIISFVH